MREPRPTYLVLRVLFLITLSFCAAHVRAAEPTEKPPEGAPIAVPLRDGVPGILRWVALTGEDSINPERDRKNPAASELVYEWKQLEGPAVNFTAGQAGLPRVWLLIHEPGEYVFELRVKNSKGWSTSKSIKFRVPKVKPLLSLSDALALTGAGEKVILPGQAWKQLAGPKLELNEVDKGAQTTVRPILEGLYLFEAMHAGEHPERRGILVPPGKDDDMGDRRPVAGILQAYLGVIDQKLIIDAAESGSRDPDGDVLKADWWCGDTEHIRIIPLKGLKAAFIATKPGQYHVQLTVTDGKLDSISRETVLHIYPPGGQSEEELASMTPPVKDPLNKMVTLGLFGKTLGDAVQKFPVSCSLTLRVDPDFLKPQELDNVRFNMGVKNGPQRVILDFMSRQTGTCYRLQRGGLFEMADNKTGEVSIWLTKPMVFDTQEAMKSASPAVDALFEQTDGSDLQSLLTYFMEGPLKGRPESTLEVQPAQQRVVAVLPEGALRRLQDVVGTLRAPRLLGLPNAPLRTLAQARLRRRLGEETISLDWSRRPPTLDIALQEFSEKTGLPAGFDVRQFPDGLPKIKLKVDDVPLREALREIVLAAGLDGCQATAVDQGLPPDAPLAQSANSASLWFYKGAEPYPTGERIWDNSFVKCYEIQALLAKYPEFMSGELLVHEIKHRIYPDSWNDPGARVAFNAPTGKLIVMHGDIAHNRVAAFLNDLDIRGDAALGPAVNASK